LLGVELACISAVEILSEWNVTTPRPLLSIAIEDVSDGFSPPPLTRINSTNWSLGISTPLLV